ncbi:MAG: type II toxin-antitoxin system VapC family toxin, partial [Deltaproteobacteria bacterium]|nr:type II toxin-antitoxin system VapC family toxin [Deltaproteobacteria bacterium]
MIIVTDTHPWIWFLAASSRLSADAKAALSDRSNLIIVPSIVMLGIRYLYNRKRISVSFGEALQRVETTANILLHPLDISVVTFAPDEFEIHDAIIVGTALYLSDELKEPVPLVTRDKT